MNSNEFYRNKQKGCMYGLAIGDALGAAIEFREPGEFEPVTTYRGFGPHGIDAGEWTDDTSMALALADSLANGFNPEDQLTKYLDWFQNGKYSVNKFCFDIGNTTRHALYEFESNKTLETADDPASSGNGSIMRLAPIAIKYSNSYDCLFYARESSKTTHGSIQCVEACEYLAYILSSLIGGLSLQKALDPPKVFIPLVENIKLGSYKTGKVKGSGWVIQSLEAAIWAVWSSHSFEEAVLKAVNLGHDSDTTGAVAGQIAGALYGYDGIPQHLIDGLAKKEMIDLYLNPILEKAN